MSKARRSARYHGAPRHSTVEERIDTLLDADQILAALPPPPPRRRVVDHGKCVRCGRYPPGIALGLCARCMGGQAA